MIDVIFLAHDIENWFERFQFEQLQKKIPFAKFVEDYDTVEAHLKAAKESNTDFFYVVDLDFTILDSFNFDYEFHDVDKQWVTRFQNTYGRYHGVRLLHKHLLDEPIEDKLVADFVNNYGHLGVKDVDIIAARYEKIEPDVVVIARDLRNWSNRDHYENVRNIFCNAKYVENDDIIDLHFQAAAVAETPFFFVIDAGYQVTSDFTRFEYSSSETDWVTRFKNSEGDHLLGVRFFHKSAFMQKIKNKAENDFINNFGKIGVKDVDLVGCEKAAIKPDVFLLTHAHDGWHDTLNKLRKTRYVRAIEGDDVIEMHQKAAELSSTSFFYVIDGGYLLTEGFDFSYQPEPEFIDWVTRFKADDQYLRGVRLMHKRVALQTITEDIDFINDFGIYGVNDVEVTAAKQKTIPLDIVFIDTGESFANDHFDALKMRFSDRVKRVSNVKGLWDAHSAAADASDTQQFFVVDADSVVNPSFTFGLRPNIWDQNYVYVWPSYCALTQLTYGNGGIKLLNKSFFQNKPDNYVDMTTTIGHQIADGIKIMEEVASYNRFYDDEYLAWRGAFRECAKLKAGIISGSVETENDERLKAWLCVSDYPHRNAAVVLKGVKEGIEFAENNRDISKLNDYDFLKELYVKSNNT